jgi:hypothetical protein
VPGINVVGGGDERGKRGHKVILLSISSERVLRLYHCSFMIRIAL